MISTDTWLHFAGFGLLVTVSMVRYFSDKPTQQQVLDKIIAVLICIMLDHAVTHILPEKIARFVYSPHYGFVPNKKNT